MHCVAGFVGHYLHFDVPRLDYILFQIDLAVAEGGLGLGSSSAQRRAKTYIVMYNPHTASAAAGDGLYYYRILNFVCQFQCLGLICNETLRARYYLHADLSSQFSCLYLVAKLLHCLDRRADKLYSALGAYLGKFYVLSQKAVSRVYCLNVCDLGGAYNAGDIQITFAGVCRAYTNRLIGKAKIGRSPVGLGVDHHCLDAQFAAGTDNPHRYFTTICYKDSRKHIHSLSSAQRRHRRKAFGCLIRPDLKKYLTVFDSLAVGYQNFYNRSAFLGLYFIHNLHCLDYANDRLIFDV